MNVLTSLSLPEFGIHKYGTSDVSHGNENITARKTSSGSFGIACMPVVSADLSWPVNENMPVPVLGETQSDQHPGKLLVLDRMRPLKPSTTILVTGGRGR